MLRLNSLDCLDTSSYVAVRSLATLPVPQRADAFRDNKASEVAVERTGQIGGCGVSKQELGQVTHVPFGLDIPTVYSHHSPLVSHQQVLDSSSLDAFNDQYSILQPRSKAFGKSL